MFSYRIATPTMFAFLFLFILVLHNSCVQNISEPERENIEISNTFIDLDRFNNELFFQVVTNQNESQALINTVSVKLMYIGGEIHTYSGEFQLYDNGTNGDLISSNGIYSLLTYADTVNLPNIAPVIKNIIMPQNFMLDDTKSDSLDIAVIIYGKVFQLIAQVHDTLNKEIVSAKNINLDNSYIELMINSDYMYMDNPLTNECDRSFSEEPDSSAFESYFKWTNGVQKNNNSNQFIFSFKIPFRSLSECGGTGQAFFRFILHDLDTMSELVADDIILTIYACGDDYCTYELENSFTCPDDCQ